MKISLLRRFTSNEKVGLHALSITSLIMVVPKGLEEMSLPMRLKFNGLKFSWFGGSSSLI